MRREENGPCLEAGTRQKEAESVSSGALTAKQQEAATPKPGFPSVLSAALHLLGSFAHSCLLVPLTRLPESHLPKFHLLSNLFSPPQREPIGFLNYQLYSHELIYFQEVIRYQFLFHENVIMAPLGSE